MTVLGQHHGKIFALPE